MGNEDGRTGNGETASLTLNFMLNIPADSVFSGKIDYDSIADDVPKIRARAVGAEHEQMLMRSDGYMIAWMLYQLTGDEEAGTIFHRENAEILHNANWQDVEKNH